MDLTLIYYLIFYLVPLKVERKVCLRSRVFRYGLTSH